MKSVDVQIIKKLIIKLNGKSNSTTQRSNLELLVVGLLWIVGIFRIALPEGFNSKIGTIKLPLNATAMEIRKAWGNGDAGSLLDAALTWSKLHQLDPTTQFWIVHFWTPGMSIIEIPFIWLEKFGIDFFWSILLLVTLISLMLFLILWRNYSPIIGRVPIVLIGIYLLTSWDFVYIFRDDLFYTEGIGYFLLIAGLSVLSWRVIHNKLDKKYLGIIGVLLASSLLVRHVSEGGLLLLVCASSLLVATMKYGKRRLSGALLTKLSYIKTSYILGAGLMGYIATLPWRIFSAHSFGGVWYSLSQAAGGEIRGIWSLSNSATAQYWSWSGLNWACQIAPTKCQALQPLVINGGHDGKLLLEVVIAILYHPLAFLSTRLHYFALNWSPGGIHFGLNLKFFNEISFILVLLWSVVFCWKARKLNETKLITLIWGSFISGQILQLTIIHYESRYFIPIRFLVLGWLLHLLIIERIEKLRHAVSK